MRNAIATMLLLVAAGFAADAPRPKLELSLRLAKTKWHVGEYLWYRLEIKNVGTTPYETYDRFWRNVMSVDANILLRFGTYPQFLDSERREIVTRRKPYPNDWCWVDVIDRIGPDKVQLRLMPGENVVAPPTTLKCQSSSSRKVPQSAYMVPTLKRLPYFHLPVGFRILPLHWIAKPGHYTIVFRLHEDMTGAKADDMGFDFGSPGELESQQRLFQAMMQEPPAEAVSNSVEFEVVP